MKKIHFVIFALAIGFSSYAQTANPSADEVLKQAYTQAAKEHKK